MRYLYEAIMEVDPEEACGESDVLLELLPKVVLDDGLESGTLGPVKWVGEALHRLGGLRRLRSDSRKREE